MTRTKTVLEDDRKDGNFPHHDAIVLGRDTFLSGWGRAAGKTSYAGWSCRPEHVARVTDWVESRSDMTDVRLVDSDYEPSGSNWHFHIYVVEEGHPALN